MKRFAVLACVVLVLITLALYAGAALLHDAITPRAITSPAGYASVLATFEPALVAHFPAAIPANAAGVRMHAVNESSVLGPTPWTLELRVIVTPAEAAAIAAQAQAAEAALGSPSGMGSIANGLETADDADPSTPLPPGFRTYTVAAPASLDVGVITVNPATGEVVYWAFDD